MTMAIQHCDQGGRHPGHDPTVGCAPCRKERAAGLGVRIYAFPVRNPPGAREELLGHLVYDHGWTEQDASAHAQFDYIDLEETHDQGHANDLDPHRAGTK